MTGTVLRVATLSSASGRQVRMKVFRPGFTYMNLRELKNAEQLWRAQARGLDEGSDAAFHAHFAAEVAFLAAKSLREWSEDPDHHILVVGIDAALEEVLGINTAYWVPDDQVWYMAVGTTRPVDQPGYPNSDRLRGIGLELVGALVDEMNKVVCAPVTLEPLDDAARRFWAARGFHDAGEEMRMSCPESRELAAQLAHSDRDDPGQGDAPFYIDRQVPALASLRP